ncbi:MAG: hypothetical protein IMW89_11555 [Ktedonobacteraceae bacterium]|nr:hypothetical protein [Ktedonobacteraceae bacterium]
MLHSLYSSVSYRARSTNIFPVFALAFLAFCLLFTGCTTTAPATSGAATPAVAAGNADACLGNCTVGSGVQNVRLFVEPEAGDHVITDAIAGAKKSVWVEMYLLTNRNVINALEEAAHRGIDTRVMLETHPYGGGPISPTETMDRLRAAGVQVKSDNPQFSLTHAKVMIIDGKTAYIMTCNLTLSALGGSKSTRNREYGIIDTNPQDVQAVIDIFNADWNRTSVQINNPNLVVSPINSRHFFKTLINSARKTLLVEAEEMFDQDIAQTLADAAQRGVQVRVILPAPRNGEKDDNKEGIDTIKRGGVQVREDARLYMHAKMMVVDGQRAFIGSQNISGASLDGNRELGIIVADRTVLATLQRTFQQDWSDSRAV